MLEMILAIFNGGVAALVDYVSTHVLTCLIPAFFIAGAINALVPKEIITHHLGTKSSALKAYPLSVVAGLLLAVCSCTILPLFAGIRKKGAGLGPALTFLYTAPATNILAIAFTGSVLGWDFASARIILSVTFAVAIGVIITYVFRKEDEKEAAAKPTPAGAYPSEPTSKQNKLSLANIAFFLLTLLAILFVGTWKMPLEWRIGGLAVLIVVTYFEQRAWFSRTQVSSWISETWIFAKTIFPLLIVGIFVAGAIGAGLPDKFLESYLGQNTVQANLIAVLFGVFMYFPTLVEVPMAKTFLALGMAKGPLLAYLLADPVISLPSILVIRRYIGDKKMLVYVGLIIIFCTLAGLIYGYSVG
ncbi:MAG: permease [Candidatus Micrarchaeota archaeon]|nr:permease [Candidatus Micrarchaeota archaeon]